MKVKDMVVTAQFPTSWNPELMILAILFEDANLIGNASDAKSSIRMCSDGTPATFKSQGSNTYRPITAAEDPPISWYLEFLTLWFVSGTGEAQPMNSFELFFALALRLALI
jgi:hypothetical protein